MGDNRVPSHNVSATTLVVLPVHVGLEGPNDKFKTVHTEAPFHCQLLAPLLMGPCSPMRTRLPDVLVSAEGRGLMYAKGCDGAKPPLPTAHKRGTGSCSPPLLYHGRSLRSFAVLFSFWHDVISRGTALLPIRPTPTPPFFRLRPSSWG